MVTLQPAGALSEIEASWRAMTRAGRPSFFLSWPWIRTWLACLPGSFAPQLMTIRQGALPIALAVLVKSTLSRLGVIKSRSWVLNATGDERFDQIFTENNGLLVQEGYEAASWRLWADSFLDEREDWDEIVLRGVPPEVLDAWRHPSVRLRQEMLLTSRYVDLDQIRRTGQPFVRGLGKKTRAHVRETTAAFARHGPLSVEVARSAAEALVYFGELKALHQQRWISRGVPGAFDYPFFEAFHTALIQHHFDEGVVQLLRVRAGERTVGVLYNFLHANEVLVYQTGSNYALVESRNRHSPGLLTHVFAIEHNTALGYGRYDFLAGDSLYKQVLSNGSAQLWWGAVQRSRLRFRLEDGLKSGWRRVAARRA